MKFDYIPFFKSNEEYKEILDKRFPLIYENKYFKLYYNPDYYPLIHIPQKIFQIPKDKFVSSMYNQILSQPLNELVAFSSTNSYSGIVENTIEYKRINPAKYKIRLHGKTKFFPIVFSQKYSKYWKLYISEYKEKKESIAIKNTNNWHDNIAQGEFQNEQNNLSWITKDHLYISKKHYNVIQNNHLDSGKFWDTAFLQEVAGNSHFVVNEGYNGWFLDLEEICNKTSKANCQKEQDGVYNLELVMEFYPEIPYRFLFTFTLLLALIFLIIFNSRLLVLKH